MLSLDLKKLDQKGGVRAGIHVVTVLPMSIMY